MNENKRPLRRQDREKPGTQPDAAQTQKASNYKALGGRGVRFIGVGLETGAGTQLNPAKENFKRGLHCIPDKHKNKGAI